MSIEEDLAMAEEALDPETAKKINNQIGEEVQKVMRGYETQIREDEGITDVKQFSEDMKAAIYKVLEQHLSLEVKNGAISPLVDGIMDNILQEKFGYNQEQLIKQVDKAKIDDYDVFVSQTIASTKDAADKSIQNVGYQKIDANLKKSDTRSEFINSIERRMGSVYGISADAKQTGDTGDFARVISLYKSDALSGAAAEQSKGVIYKRVA